jgi:hypothetical protein
MGKSASVEAEITEFTYYQKIQVTSKNHCAGEKSVSTQGVYRQGPLFSLSFLFNRKKLHSIAFRPTSSPELN